MLTEFQHHVAQVVLDAIASLDFALGEGQALGVHGIVDRASKDLDGYSPSLEAETYQRAEIAALDALTAAGLTATVVQEMDWMRVIEVEDPGTHEQVVIDLAYDARTRPPIQVVGLGAVIDVEDVVYGKLRAFVERFAERDYIDIDAILQDGRWTVYELYERIAPNFPAELPDSAAFAERLEWVTELDEFELVSAGLTMDDIAALKQRLTSAAAKLRQA